MKATIYREAIRKAPKHRYEELESYLQAVEFLAMEDVEITCSDFDDILEKIDEVLDSFTVKD